MDQTSERPEEHYTARFYRKQVEQVATRLRDMADDVERAAEPRDTPYIDGSARFGVTAEQIVHTITWGLANCSLDGVIHAATLADMAEREATAPAVPVPPAGDDEREGL